MFKQIRYCLNKILKIGKIFLKIKHLGIFKLFFKGLEPSDFNMPSQCKTIFFGDSVFLRISKYDSNKDSLSEMLHKKFESSNSYIFAYSALSIVHYIGCLSKVSNVDSIEKIYIPINFRSFSMQWELNPIWQYKIFLHKMLQSSGKIINIEDLIPKKLSNKINGSYFKYGVRDAEFFIKNIDLEVNTIDEVIENRRKIFAFCYLFDKDVLKNSLRYQAFKFIDQKLNLKSKVIFYVLPINFEAIEFLFGKESISYLKSNINVLINGLNESGFEIHDFSSTIDRFGFFNEFEPNEHLNEIGRRILFNKIIDIVK